MHNAETEHDTLHKHGSLILEASFSFNIIFLHISTYQDLGPP